MANKKTPALVRATARGLVASMAMSGFRAATSNLGLLEQAPPEAIMERHAPEAVKELDAERRKALTELVHWAYGSGGGLVFGMLPGWVRRRRLSGPVFGLGVWLGFELGIAPLLGVQNRQGKLVGRTMLMLDHVLYGVVVAGRLAPEPEVTRRDR